MREFRAEAGKRHAVKEFPDPDHVARGAFRQTEGDVFGDREMREQSEVLKHQANGAAFGRDAEDGIADQLAIDPDGAFVLHVDARDHPERRRLAAA